MSLPLKDANGVINSSAPLYDAAYSFSTSYTAAQLATIGTSKNILVLQGKASVVTRLKLMRISIKDGGTAGNTEFKLVKTTALDTGGTPVAITPGQHSTGTIIKTPAQAVAGTTVSTYAGAAGPTNASTGAATFKDESVPTAGTSGLAAGIVEWKWADKGDAPPTLEAATEQLALLYVGTAPTSSVVYVNVQFEEGVS